jgi:DNA-binding transcriptional MerR regulator
MAAPAEKRYTITEVSEMTGVSLHVLRSWERRIGKLRPKRTRAGRRTYTLDDIELVRTVKYLVKHKGMTLAGANRVINQEGHKGVLPKSPESALNVIKKIQAEVRAMLEDLKRPLRETSSRKS